MKDDFEVEVDLKEEVVSKVDDVSLVDRAFDGTFSGDGDEDFVIRECVRRRLGWKPWKWKKNEEDDGEDEEENSGCDYLTRMSVINEVKHENEEKKF
ncbi:hypothetical protein Tco_1443177 [Tanacetum coccineum]